MMNGGNQIKQKKITDHSKNTLTLCYLATGNLVLEILDQDLFLGEGNLCIVHQILEGAVCDLQLTDLLAKLILHLLRF